MPFLSRKLVDSLIAINLLNVERRNLNTTWMQIETVSAPSLWAPSQVIAILDTENWQKVNSFKPVYLGNYRY